MRIDSFKKWVTFTDMGTSKSGRTKVWAITGKKTMAKAKVLTNL